MSSRRSSTKPYIFGVKKLSPNNFSPKNPLSISGYIDNKTSLIGRAERINTTDMYTSNSPNRLKDISHSVTNSSIDTKAQPDPNAPKFSFIKMLTEKKHKDITENFEYQKLREEVIFLRQDNENKDKVIESLTRENEKLQKEMQELQATVELAKGKITSRFQEYSKKTQELEAEIKALRQENQTYRSHSHKACEYSSAQKMVDITEEQADQSESDIDQTVDESCKQITDNGVDNMGVNKLQLTLSTPQQQTRVLEVRKNSMSSPNQASMQNQNQTKMKRFTLSNLKLADPTSPNKIKGVTTPLRKVPLLGNLEKLNPESYGICTKTLSIATSYEDIGISVSSESSWAGNLLTTNLSAFRKSPKAVISPVVKNKKLIKTVNENELK